MAAKNQRRMEGEPAEPDPKPAENVAERASWLAFGANRFEQTKSVLAAIGLLAIVAGILRAVR